MMQSRVVDTAILVEKVVGVGIRRKWGLRVLCKELLDIEIQNHGMHAHDCLEDALATREVAIWCIQKRSSVNGVGKCCKQDGKGETARPEKATSIEEETKGKSETDSHLEIG
jgi:DNA polymerase III epsilon subunit-like protein